MSSQSGAPVPIVVTPRAGADLDGVACAIAYAELLTALGNPACPVLAGCPDAEARFVIQELCWKPAIDVVHSDQIVLVDASDILGLPDWLEPQQVIEVIDHRLHHQATRLFPKAKVQIEAVGAAATLITERWQQSNRRPSTLSTQILQAAILSNTQNLVGSVTTTRDRSAFGWLDKLTPLPANLLTGQFQARTAEILADLDAALVREAKTFHDGTAPFILTQLEVLGGMALVEQLIVAAEKLGPRTMVNLVDIQGVSSILVVINPEFRAWVEKELNGSFEGPCWKVQPAMLRKQIIARLLRSAG